MRIRWEWEGQEQNYMMEKHWQNQRNTKKITQKTQIMTV